MWATFDCYGTLVDWEAGIGSAIARVAPGHEQRLLAAYYDLEHVVEAERPFRPYREVLAETLRRAAEREGVALASPGPSVLAETLPDWPVFADAGPSLQALRDDGWELAILSNVDRDLIEGTLRHIPVQIDLLVTAQDVESYKPGLTHFEHFRELSGVQTGEWFHVARSWFHDMVPARQLGIPGVWINRGADPDDPSVAAAVLPDLTGLPETLTRLRLYSRWWTTP
jgi:2-haloacid dehalogenase